ncbi:ABC transporter ATP-binding protein [Corynebacterium comes]|uniref:Daunorubicin/doxorubicin resistance ATP-binding protein DrrA n=1 Tax=Corynebacterium comes TaxID=2675218 RepID=A0A6B8VH82_9CORY|nr:ABC transporter ATP-binding protein [Corynebacterium comes]QGU04652.1 Daunorubicin/doxorubicin resistance ATP-binding protein DrrA [Corynebacterium comes]
MSATFDGAPGREVGPALKLESVVKTFGATTAVNGLSLTARRGEVFALLGPNGAGKTTTIEMCEGFLRPTSGEIRVLGLDPVTRPDEVRRRIGIMLQGGGSYSGIRVAEMLRLAAAYNDNPHDPEWLIDVLGLDGVRNTTWRRLSGGQQQRLSLALAIIGRPELIFLDEPTAGLDAQSRLAVWELIDALRTDGVTVILTTHLMDEAEALADHIVIMDKGSVVAQGTPAELTATGETTARVTFETDSPLDLELAGSRLTDLCPDAPGIEAIRPLHYCIPTPATPVLVAALAGAAADQDVLVRRLDVDHRNLEEVFLDITGRSLRS